VNKQRIKEILVWTYMGAIPLFPFLSYYVAKAGILDYMERFILILVLLCHMLLNHLMIIQFIKVITSGEFREWVGQGSGL
jgi:hypothetical protein